MEGTIAKRGTVGLGIVVHGKRIREFEHHDGNTYVWARKGTEYSIATWNMTGRRVEVVITVDGLDVIKGKTGDYRTQRGYIIDAYSKPDAIPGFRLSSEEVARFTFGAPEESYAALTDRPNDIGVIGAAFFHEEVLSAALGFDRSVTRGDDFLGTRGGEGLTYGDMRGVVTGSTPSVGTVFGRVTDFHTSKTTFRRMNPVDPDIVLTLQYRSKQELAEMGIEVHKSPALQVASREEADERKPNPFPGIDGCKPPHGWNRG